MVASAQRLTGGSGPDFDTIVVSERAEGVECRCGELEFEARSGLLGKQAQGPAQGDPPMSGRRVRRHGGVMARYLLHPEAWDGVVGSRKLPQPRRKPCMLFS